MQVHSRDMLAAQQQNWGSLTLLGFGQGYWSWFAPKPQVERQQEGKELIWKSSWILHLHLMLDRMGLEKMTTFVQRVYTETLSFWETFNI